MRVHLEHFRPFKNLLIDTSTVGPGLIAVVGDNQVSDYSDSNASGKSAFAIMGLTWGIFGQCPGLSTAAKVIKRGSARGTKARATIDLPLSSGNLTIIRERTKSKHTVKYKHGEGEWQSWDKDRALVEIEGILGITYDQFSKLMSFDGEFCVATKTDAPLKTLLGSLVPVDVGPAAKPANSSASTARQEQSSAAAVVERFDTDIAESKQILAQAQVTEQAWNTQQAENIAQADADIVLQAANVEEATTNGTAWANIVATAGDLVTARTAIDSLRTAIDENNRHIGRAANNIARLLPLIDVGFEPNNCVSCNQVLPAHMVEDARQRHGDLAARQRQELDENYTVKRECELKVKKYTEDLNKASAALAAAESTDVIHAEQQRHIWRATYSKASEALSVAQRHRGIWSSSVNPSTRDVQSKLARHEGLLKQHQDLIAAKESMAEEVALSQYVADMTAKNGLPHFAIETLLPRVSAYASAFLSKMSASQMSVSFLSSTVAGNGKLHVHATTDTGGETYTDMSQGEKRRIDVAAFLALHKMASEIIGRIPVLVVDELLDHSTDATAKQSMVGLLRDYAIEEGIQVLLVTNDHGIIADRNKFAQVIQVVKTTDGATAHVV